MGMCYRQDKDPTRFSRGMIECNGKSRMQVLLALALMSCS
jgi:RNase P/RNase MRP subunit POP5